MACQGPEIKIKHESTKYSKGKAFRVRSWLIVLNPGPWSPVIFVSLLSTCPNVENMARVKKTHNI